MLPHDDLIVLSDDEEKKVARYKAIFSMLIQHGSEIRVARLIEKLYRLNYRQARNLINQTKDLFCDIQATNKEAMRVLQIERRRQMVREVMADKDLSADQRHHLRHVIELRIEKIAGLEDKDAISFKDLLKQLQLPDVVITDNPAILDIQHEEVEE